MRRFIKLSICVMLVVVAVVPGDLSAGTPRVISYQGRATNATGTPVANGTHSFIFYLYPTSAAATTLWSDAVSLQTTDGLFDYLLGSNPAAPLPDTVFSKFDSLFLGVRIDGQLLTPPVALTTAPYAMRVNTVDKANGGTIWGSLAFRNTGDSSWYSDITPDASGGGAGYFRVYGAGNPQPYALTVDGNYVGTGEPRVWIMGHSRGASFAMDQSGNSSVVLPPSAIGASEIEDEPGVGSCLNAQLSLVNGVQYVCGRTMFAPADGHILLTAAAMTGVTHTQGQQSRVQFAISESMTSFPINYLFELLLPSSLPSGDYAFPLVAHALYPISEGSKAFYIVANKGNNTVATIYNTHFTELFVPTAYTTVYPPPSKSGASTSSSTFDPETEHAEAEAFNQKRISDELARLSAELEALKAELHKENNGTTENR